MVLRRPSFCRLSSSCPSIPHHLVHGAAAAGAAGQGTVGVHSSYSQAEIHPVSTHHGQTSSSASTISSAGITPLTSSSLQQQEQPGSQLPRASTSTGHHKQLPMHPDNEATRLMVNSKKSSVSSSALDSVALRSSPAGDDDDDEAVNNVKILVNDITPASSQEFLQASNPSSRRSSASDVRHSPFQGNSIGGNTAQRLAKRSQLQSQNSESSRRQSWTDLSKTDAIISQTDIIGGITLPLLHGTHDSPKTVNNRRAHKSPIKLQRSVSLNSLKSAGVCDGGGPDSASNSSSELHTSSTNKGAPPTSSATSDSSTTASGNTISLQTDISRISAENQTTVGGSAGVSRLAVAAPGAGKPPSGAFSSSHSNLTTTSSTYAGGGSTQAGSPIVSQSSAIGIPAGNVTAGIGGSDALHRGQLPPLQLLPSSEHNYSMQPPPSPRQHRSASSGETMLLLHRCQEDMPQQSAQTGALAAPSSGAQSGGPPPVPPKFAKPLPPGVLSKKLPPPSLQKSVSTPSIVVAQETLLQHSQSDSSRVEDHASLVHQLSVGNGSRSAGQLPHTAAATQPGAGPTVTAAGHHLSQLPHLSQPSGRTGPPHKSSLLHNQRSIVYLLEEEDEQPDTPHVQDYVAMVCRSQSATGRPVAAAGLLNSHGSHGGLGGNVASAADSDDEKFIGKRTKKRGSLFFRKKKVAPKDPSKAGSPSSQGGTPSPPPGRPIGHQFVAISYSIGSVQCHVCFKSLDNRPALRCEICNVAVHDVHSCRDQIADCTKFKTLLNKSMLINKSASQLAVKERSSANLASALKSSASGLGSKDRKLQQPQASSTFSRSNIIQNVQTLQNDTTGGSSKESSPSSAAKGSGTTGEELDSPHGPHGADMAELYAGSLNFHEPGSASMESLDSGSQALEELIGRDLDDPILRLLDDEPSQWSVTVDKKVVKKLKERDVKRQEAIYELILTEKHHCVTLKIMEKIYMDRMCNELQLQPEMVNRMFPRLAELLSFHCTFLLLLRSKQAQANPDNQTIDTIGDVLLQMFQGDSATKMLTAYGAFCSRHKDAVAVYKEMLKAEKKFALFIARRSRLALCKGRGIPECILLVTQRLTKYPLMIDALIKSSKDHPDEIERLKVAQVLVKDVINGVNAQVAEAERDARLLEIYHKVDAKSTAYLKGHKFKKSDLLSSNRKLRHEGTISLKNARNKQLDVTAVLLSDVIFFLQENNQKYVFAAFDNKPSVISLHKLLVRERAGQDARALYLISSNPEEPEMFEFICVSPKDKAFWLDAIRKAIETCPAETDDSQEKDAEEVARADRLRHLQILLHDGDRSIAQICQVKLTILIEMLEIIGVDQDTIDKINPRDFKYGDLLQKLSPEETNQMLLTAASQVHQIFARIPVPLPPLPGSDGTNQDYRRNSVDVNDSAHQSLGRSVSSAGEHQSAASNCLDVTAMLPKRAETFGGFDANTQKGGVPSGLPPYLTAIKKKLFLVSAETAAAKERTKKESSREFPECHLQVKDKSLQRRSVTGLDQPSPSDSTADAPPATLPLRQLEGLTAVPLFFTHDPRQQLEIIADLTHNLSIIMCLYCQSASSMESLRLQATEMSEQLQCRNPRKQSYRPDVQLEELRNLQEQLSSERAEWQRQCQIERQQLDRQREEIQKREQWISEQQAELDSRLSAATAQYRVTNQGQTGAGQGGQVGHFVNQSSIHVQSAPTQAPRCPVSGSVSLSHSRSVSLHLFPLPTRTVFYLLH
ncbi:uncharacterized protein LOC111268096 isoform X9 [Varroa jacobsoni]|uniref:uncharacterized protein LOC111268096 isoform X9 n=1 Tax=Varroa jacobsoni TaxID=62625 RepID=UPI000BF4C170|nr:uncharacterized protein LOC111268096 isoform X9 [Varroa jacobsoni]